MVYNYGVEYDKSRHIGDILGLTEVNARQLLTRARRRLMDEAGRPLGGAEQRRLLDAFVDAAQAGDLSSLERLLAADVARRTEVLHAAA